ncbi:MAG: hypothetical protein Q7W45_12330 [Bacteroidota bacterium]|nr:hypothetical protein [Bacteroidota bacterium]MDP3146885.1 hypothetical protein [Bacteroidota bacterium]
MKNFILTLTMFASFATYSQTAKGSHKSNSNSNNKTNTNVTSQKQYKSAESGRYITKTQAEKSPSTTYSTKRKK